MTSQRLEAEVVKKPSIPLDEIVKEKYVVCLECGKKMRTLKAHLRKTHQLAPAEYFRRYSLDPKKYPLVCKEYSAQRSKLAKEKAWGNGASGAKSLGVKRGNPESGHGLATRRRGNVGPKIRVMKTRCDRDRQRSLFIW